MDHYYDKCAHSGVYDTDKYDGINDCEDITCEEPHSHWHGRMQRWLLPEHAEQENPYDMKDKRVPHMLFERRRADLEKERELVRLAELVRRADHSCEMCHCQGCTRPIFSYRFFADVVDVYEDSEVTKFEEVGGAGPFPINSVSRVRPRSFSNLYCIKFKEHAKDTDYQVITFDSELDRDERYEAFYETRRRAYYR